MSECKHNLYADLSDCELVFNVTDDVQAYHPQTFDFKESVQRACRRFKKQLNSKIKVSLKENEV